MDIKKIKQLMKIMDKGNLAEIEYEEKDSRVKLVKYSGSSIVPVMQQVPQSIQAVNVSAQEKDIAQKEENKESDENKYHVIRSPMVGTFYRSPSPDAQPYVKEGDNVNNDSIVCIIESMKVMNEIEADVKGKIVKILVENAQPVEYNQPLFYVDID